MTARHSLRVFSKCFSQFSILDQHLIVLWTLSSCVCNNSHRSLRSHLSVPGLCCPSFLRKASISGVIGFSNWVFKAVNSSSFSCPNSLVCVLRNLGVNGDAMQTKFGKNRRKKLHKPMKEGSSVYVVGILRSLIVPVVRITTSSRPVQMMCPR